MLKHRLTRRLFTLFMLVAVLTTLLSNPVSHQAEGWPGTPDWPPCCGYTCSLSIDDETQQCVMTCCRWPSGCMTGPCSPEVEP